MDFGQFEGEKIFVTKADKGGSTLIMNFADVKAATENELFNENKFSLIGRSSDDQLSHVKHEVKSLTLHLEQRKLISSNDKTLITGLNENNNHKRAPEYQPEPPYAYPLFKIHKLSKPEIANKKVPPCRLVHASKFGPLYRMEKWCSPYLTKISRAFCQDEFILDTGDLIKNLEAINNSKKLENENVNLYTLDVEQLYPNIQPGPAMQAIRDAFAMDKTTDKNTKSAILHFIQLSFDNSYITYQDKTYKSIVGIPTGGSLSRQIADIFLHWILFIKMTPKLSLIQAIRYWQRFIDDCIGVWRGTKRSFINFVNQLNTETMKYGIKFPTNEVQFGKSVHFLDLCVYLDEDNTIHYRGYTKPTDAKRYLNPSSFHPRSVFNSIPFSQMLRTLRNNSKEETRSIELKQCSSFFEASGYKPSTLIEMEEKAIRKTNTINIASTEPADTLVFPLHFFTEVADFKSVVQSLDNTFKELIGNTRILFALKKSSSIGNKVVRNKQLSFPNSSTDDQHCNGRGCRQCPLVNDKNIVEINGNSLRIPSHLNCKSKNVIYMWVCKVCGEKETYFGRTTQTCRDRSSGHRGCFSEEKWDKSALSMHAREAHQTQFSLENFAVAVVKKVSPQRLRREEYKFIDRYQTNTLGLNRYKV